jgi:hypothetical protein
MSDDRSENLKSTNTNPNLASVISEESEHSSVIFKAGSALNTYSAVSP